MNLIFWLLARAGGGNSLPPSVAGISVWSPYSSNQYEDSAGTIPAVTDSMVGNVADYETLLSAFTQSTSSAKPIKRIDSNLAVLEFDGVDDSLGMASVLLSESGSYTICIGVRTEDVAGTHVLFYQRGTSANPMSCQVEYVAGVPRARWVNDANTTTVTLNSGLSSRAWANDTITITKSGNTRTLRVNGTQVATDTITLGTTTLTQTGIGLDPYAVTGFLTGLISNIVVHPSSALTGSDLSSVESFVTQNNQFVTPALTLAIDDISVAESVGNATFTVTMSRTNGASVTVDYATSNGTATAGSDYTSTSGTLTFTAGQTSKTISVPITDDSDQESDETFTMTLSNASAGTISDATGICTILANDDVPTLIQSLGGMLIDFTAAKTGVSVGNAISTVTTSEGGGYTFDSTNSPTLQQNGNGKTYVQMTSSSSMKFTPTAGASATAFAALCANNTSSLTVLAAVQFDDVSGASWKTLVAWSHAANQYVQVQANGTNVICNQRQTTTSQDATKGTLTVSTDCTVGGVKNGTNSRKAMLAGILGTANTTDFTESVSYEYNTIGCNRKGAGAGSDYFNGRIYAIAIIPSDISATGDFTTINSWMAARYAA